MLEALNQNAAGLLRFGLAFVLALDVLQSVLVGLDPCAEVLEGIGRIGAALAELVRAVLRDGLDFPATIFFPELILQEIRK